MRIPYGKGAFKKDVTLLGGGGYETVAPNDTRGMGFIKVSRDTFPKFRALFLHFDLFLKVPSTIKCHVLFESPLTT